MRGRPDDVGPPPAPGTGSGGGGSGQWRSRTRDGRRRRRHPSCKININTATAEELAELPRVGPVLAGRIVEFREQHGPYGQASDLDAVPGIGPVMLEALVELVTVWSGARWQRYVDAARRPVAAGPEDGGVPSCGSRQGRAMRPQPGAWRGHLWTGRQPARGRTARGMAAVAAGSTSSRSRRWLRRERRGDWTSGSDWPRWPAGQRRWCCRRLRPAWP